MGEEIASAGGALPRVGDGEFPRDLDRLNWGAVLLPWLWSLMHGSWRWFLGLSSLRAAEIAVWFLVNRSPQPPLLVALTVVTVATVVWTSASVMLGMRANGLYWERELKRVTRESGQSVPRLAVPVVRYIRSQLLWARWGLGLLAYSLLALAWQNRHLSPELLPRAILYVVLTTSILGALFAADRLGWIRSRGRS